ncbi:hypothetical protein [Microbacterium sp. No. 7]|uniref:hypothetical protein n=1 Tax=Microbacterium sp. No. 7 TaxID=1714373 RepID=UPI0006D2ABA5|nr:hypothetical protein [Microbacterium sp. No. 7]ALJ19531.1 hypothetical protein AOA12_06255 [Microbacterium sp. No. 7]
MIPDLIHAFYVLDGDIPHGALRFPRPDEPGLAELTLGECRLAIGDDELEDGDGGFTYTVTALDGDVIEHDGGVGDEAARRVIQRFINEWKEGRK